MTLIWQIQLLGRLCALREQVEITRFRTQKTAGLLAYLACHARQAHPRDSLLEIFWPDADLDAGRNNLNVALNSLRRQLEPPGVPAGSVLLSDRTQVRINSDVISVDVDRFEADVQSGLQAPNCSDGVALLARAVEHYGGALIPGHYEEWVMARRDRLADLYMSALRRLIRDLVQVQEWERALDYARRGVQTDPLREEFHRSVMRLCVAVGRPAGALDQFHELERQLKTILNASPSASTRELAAQVAAGLGSDGLQRRPDASSAPAHESAAPASTPTPVDLKSNLPLQLARFFGRETEIETLQALLTGTRGSWDRGQEVDDRPSPVVGLPPPGARLLTLTGPGGIGKTRLALEVAGQLQARFPGGAWFVALAEISSPELIFETICTALQLPCTSAREALDQIAETLEGQPALMVLDNFEQLAETGARHVGLLMQRISTLKLLVTSRQALELAGEQEFIVPPLPIPNRTGTPERLLEFPAVQLFVDRAQARRADFQITRKNSSTVARLCERLEGLPLAIELAASWARLLTPDQMAAQLDNRLDFLVSRRADIPARHRTLRTVIESSYHLLSPEARQLFCRLSIFRGGWTLAAAVSVCFAEAKRAETQLQDGMPSSSLCALLDSLSTLQSRSLIVAEQADLQETEEMRYTMLETLREFASEQLRPAERLEVSRLHAEYFQRFAEEAQLELDQGEQAQWLHRLEMEHDNLRAALDWYATHPDGAVGCLKMAAALGVFWEVRGHWSEGRRRLEMALGRLPIPEEDEALLNVLPAVIKEAGILSYRQSDYPVARVWFEQYLEIARRRGDTSVEANALKLIGNIAYMQSDFTEARTLYEQSLALYRNMNHPIGAAHLLDSLANVAHATGNCQLALSLRQEVLPIMREAGDLVALSVTLNNLGNDARALGDYDIAKVYLSECLQIARSLGNRKSVAGALHNLATVASCRGDLVAAAPLFRESLLLFRDIGDRQMMTDCLEFAAAMAVQQGAMERACLLAGAAETQRNEIGTPRLGDALIEFERTMAPARAALGAEKFAATCAEGNGLMLERAFTLAMETSEEYIGRENGAERT